MGGVDRGVFGEVGESVSNESVLGVDGEVGGRRVLNGRYEVGRGLRMRW